jgi:hypothetical protein
LRRGAFTLIETAIVVSITSVLFALSVTTIVALFRVQRQFQADADHERTVWRLASRFREDAHTAVSAASDDGLSLGLGEGGRVRYTFAAPAVVREIRQGDEIRHRDTFTLTNDAAVTFSQEHYGDGQLVWMKIDSRRVVSRPPIATVAIEIAAAIKSEAEP